MALDSIAKSENISFESARYVWKSQFRFKGREFILIKPTTYVNLSGKAVSYWLQKEKIPDENLLVIADDIALPIGTIRIRKKGGAGGHNGLFDIIEHLGTDAFTRLRIGAGGDFPLGHQVRYVLGKWQKEELDILLPKIEKCTDIVKSFGTIGIDRTMNQFNSK